jgi:hypothetical protein
MAVDSPNNIITGAGCEMKMFRTTNHFDVAAPTNTDAISSQPTLSGEGWRECLIPHSSFLILEKPCA